MAEAELPEWLRFVDGGIIEDDDEQQGSEAQPLPGRQQGDEIQRAVTVDDVEEQQPALVLACEADDPVLRRRVRGVYARFGSNHGKHSYTRLPVESTEDAWELDNDREEAFLYYWDHRDGPEYEGWWLGPNIGSAEVFWGHFRPQLVSDGDQQIPVGSWGTICTAGAAAFLVKIQPYRATLAIMEAALPDCEPVYLISRLCKRGDANEALEKIFDESTPYPRRVKRARRSTASSSSCAVGQTADDTSQSWPSSSSTSKVPPEELKQQESTWFDSSKHRPTDLYKKEALDLLLKVFNGMRKAGIDKALRHHNGALAPAWKELNEVMNAPGGLPRGLRMEHPRQAASESDFKSLKNRRLRQEVDFIRRWHAMTDEEMRKQRDREALRRHCELEGAMLECECCFEQCLPVEVAQCSMGHLFCAVCVKRLVESMLGDGELLSVACPSTCGCKEVLPPVELNKVLPEDLKVKLEKCLEESNLQALKQQENSSSKLEECPFCGFAMFMDVPPEENKVFVCLKEECGKESCRLCKEENHIPKRCEEVEKKSQSDHRKAIEERMSEAMIRFCPVCKAKNVNSAFIKEEGCNKMTCPRCKTFVCYVCNEKIDRKVGYAHFCQHPTDPGRPCKRCAKCPLWSGKDFDKKEAERVLQAGRSFHSEYVSEHAEAPLEEPEVLKAKPDSEEHKEQEQREGHGWRRRRGWGWRW